MLANVLTPETDNNFSGNCWVSSDDANIYSTRLQVKNWSESTVCEIAQMTSFSHTAEIIQTEEAHGSQLQHHSSYLFLSGSLRLLGAPRKMRRVNTFVAI